MTSTESSQYEHRLWTCLLPLSLLLVPVSPLQAQVTDRDRSVVQPSPSRMEWLSGQLTKHLDFHLLGVVPATTLWSTDDAEARGVWDQPLAGASLAYWPWERLFATVSVFAYPNPEDQQAWMPDFTYEFGYTDWRPYTFYFTYASYNSNRYPWRVEKLKEISSPLEGVLTSGWRYEWLPQVGAKRHSPWWVGGSIAAHLVPMYFNYDGTAGYNQLSASWGTTISHRSHLFAELRFYVYPGHQNPWDPDFTYSFGWTDWRPWRLTLRWDNYSGNRFPWAQEEGNGGWTGGALVLDFNLGL